MKKQKPIFILAGNSSYNNKGCEAIVRGTVKILRSCFGDSKFIILSHFRSKKQFEEQKLKETDKDIIHKKAFIFSNLKPLRVIQKIILKFLGSKIRQHILYKEIIPYLKECKIVLSVGGDNYSLDYKKPKLFVDLDNLVISYKKPIIIWAGSVGPFSKLPRYENYMRKHLGKISGIFAREAETINYLNRIGVFKNVKRTADPAFLLQAKEPNKNLKIKKRAIGINLSPLMAKYATGGNLKKWTEIAVKIIKEISVKTKKPIYLIPHVVDPKSDDHDFLKKVLSLIDDPKKEIYLISDNLNAAEIKWVISKMFVFAGARMHSVIAALSSGVPALSFSYSIKSKGIIKDIYEDNCFCLDLNNLKPFLVAEKVNKIILNRDFLTKKINLKIPTIKELAMNGGKYLKELI